MILYYKFVYNSPTTRHHVPRAAIRFKPLKTIRTAMFNKQSELTNAVWLRVSDGFSQRPLLFSHTAFTDCSIKWLQSAFTVRYKPNLYTYPAQRRFISVC
jgi:hypothetical protein